MPSVNRNNFDDDLTEVMQEVPAWYVRLGLLLMFLVVLITIIVISTFKYPSKIEIKLSLLPIVTEVLMTGLVDQSNKSKIAIGQVVRIELEDFPVGTFGYLQGTVTEVSALPTNHQFSVEIRLSNNISNKGIELDLDVERKGIGIIFSKEKTILKSIIEKM